MSRQFVNLVILSAVVEGEVDYATTVESRDTCRETAPTVAESSSSSA